mgnify:CR=1 FL=1
MTFPPPDFEGKIHAPESLLRAVHALPRPLVFTNGVFDVLHRGHVTYLAQARALGASLLVAVNSDASARKLGKDEDRPVNALEDRLALVAALGVFLGACDERQGGRVNSYRAYAPIPAEALQQMEQIGKAAEAGGKSAGLVKALGKKIESGSAIDLMNQNGAA